MLPPAVAWMDPGGMTGIAVLSASRHFSCDEFIFQDAGNKLYGLCSYYKSDLKIGWERFTIGPETHKLTRQPEAMEMIGVARYLAQNWGCQILTPAAPDQRNMATPAMLKRLGWWVPGKDDAQSAAQHMLAWLLRTNQLPPRERELLGT